MSKRRPRGNNWTAEQPEQPAPLSLEKRAEARVLEICEALGCSLSDLRSASREQFYVFARYIAVAQLTADGFPYSVSADAVGRERSMVRHGLDTFDDLTAQGHSGFVDMLAKWTAYRERDGETGGITSVD